MFCAQQAAEFRAHQSEIESRGARLAFIGSGSPAHAKYFRTEILKLPAEPQPGEPRIYSDSRLDAFKAAGLKYGAWRTLGPKALGHSISALRAGFRQHKTMGKPWQQGGVLVVAPGGKLLYSYASEEAGDHPKFADVLAALPAAKG